MYTLRSVTPLNTVNCRKKACHWDLLQTEFARPTLGILLFNSRPVLLAVYIYELGMSELRRSLLYCNLSHIYLSVCTYWALCVAFLCPSLTITLMYLWKKNLYVHVYGCKFNVNVYNKVFGMQHENDNTILTMRQPVLLTNDKVNRKPSLVHFPFLGLFKHISYPDIQDQDYHITKADPKLDKCLRSCA